MTEPLKRAIPGCEHQLERMAKWNTEGACPICLTADVLMKNDEIKRLRMSLRRIYETGTSNGWTGNECATEAKSALTYNAGLQGRTREAGESLCKPLLGENGEAK